MYIALDVVLNEAFADTASREYLIKRAGESNISPKQATKTVIKAEFNIDINIGDRFSLGDYNFVAINKVENLEWKLECETSGSGPNSLIPGDLIPIGFINGLDLSLIHICNE